MSNTCSVSLVTNWNLNISGFVYSIKASSETVYIGGDFRYVGSSSIARNNIAAVETSGELLPWNLSINGQVRAIKSDTDTVYNGGPITSMRISGSVRISSEYRGQNTVFSNILNYIINLTGFLYSRASWYPQASLSF